MSFLNPLLLAGVATVAIPIIIHLLNKRKVEHVVWAAMRFLRVSIEQNERRLRIEDLLLLILRCVMVALLALALARPAIRSAVGGLFGQSAVTAVIIVDQSYSMSQTDGTQSRFEKAKTAAGQIIDTLPSGSSAAVWMSSDAVSPLIPDPTLDLNLARATIQGAQLCDRATDVAPALRSAIDLLQGKPGLRKEIYFITDGQANGWKQMDAVRQMLASAGQNISTNLILVTSHEDQNLGVADLRQVSGLAGVGQPLRFTVKVTNYGSAEVHDVRTTLKVDDNDTADETSIPSIPPNDSRSVSLFAKLHDAGYHTITASIPPDRLPADDNRTIVVRAISHAKVLLVDGNPGFSPQESEVFFLKSLFGAADQNSAADQSLVQAKTVSPTDLATVNLDEYDAVILADVPDFSTTTLDAFAAYLQHGGGLLFFPGDHLQEAFYNQQLLGKYHFLCASFGEPQGQADAKEKLIALQGSGFSHPISSIWNDSAAGSPSSASFFRITPLAIDPTGASSPSTSAGAGEPHVVMQFADGSPAVLERSWGQGEVIQFASTASTRWNDLPVHPGIYVPLIYRCLGSIVGRQDEGLNIRAGEKFVYHPAIDLLGKTATITRPTMGTATASSAAAHDSRQIEMARELATLSYDDTDVAGTYGVEIADSPAMKFAVQSDPEESQLADLSDEQKQSLAGVCNVIEWTAGTSLEQKLATSRLGTELWLPLISTVIALAVAETILASWFSRPK
jgi:hypothetical protein